MKIRFNSDKERNPTQDGSLKVLYAPGRHCAVGLALHPLRYLMGAAESVIILTGGHGGASRSDAVLGMVAKASTRRTMVVEDFE